MKVLLTSDLHMDLKQLEWIQANAEQYGLIVIAGDLLQLAHTQEKSAQIDSLLPLLKGIREKCPLIVSSGNHDGNAQRGDNEEYAKWTQKLKALNIVSDGSHLDIDSRRFTCCPWWNGVELREEMLTQLKNDSDLNAESWIWIHHAPPRGSRIAWTPKGNVGDPLLLKLIGKYKPSLVLCGHIHNAPFYAEGGWCEKIGTSWAFNSGKQPGDIPAYITLDLEKHVANRFSYEGVETQELS